MKRILAAAFGLAVIFGALCQRTRFCTMGAISDVYTMPRMAPVITAAFRTLRSRSKAAMNNASMK